VSGRGERELDRNMIILTLITWVAVAASVITMVIYDGLDGAAFAFIVLLVAVPVWSRVIREYGRGDGKREDELAGEIRELIREMQELKRSLEE